MKRVFSCLIGLCLAAVMGAQSYPASYHLLEELRELDLSTLFQDEDGFIWLGGADGLFRFDGRILENFSAPRDSQATVSVIAEDHTGRLLVGYASGAVARLGQDKLYPMLTPDLRTSITGLSPIDESLFLATYGEGLWCRKGSAWHCILPDLSIYDMVTSSQEFVWLATDQGVYQLNNQGKLIRHWQESSGLPDRIVQHLVAADSGVWAGTYTDGVAFLPVEGGPVQQSLTASNWVYGQLEDLTIQPDGTLWMTTWEHGLVEWHPGQMAPWPVQVNQQVEASKLTELLVDREGATWVLVAELGLLNVRGDVAIFDGGAFAPAGELLAIHAAGIYIWVSTMEGLFRYNVRTRQWEHHRPTGLTDDDLIISIHEVQPEEVWLGTFGQGLLRYDVAQKTIQRITEADGLINDNILDMEATNGSLWLATLGGVSQATFPVGEPRWRLRFQNYDQENGLGANYIYKVVSDSQGRVWFATDGQGLTVLENGTFTNYNASDGLRSEVIYSATTDPQGNIWFSTLHDGIYRFDGDSFLHFGLEEGLHGVDIVALACDPHGHLTIVHEEGVDVMDTRHFHLIHLEDDIGLLEVNANLNVITTRENGEVWFGLQQGMVRYKPGGAAQSFIPTTWLDYIEVYLEEYPVTGDTVFAYSDNHLTFGFVGLWFANPAQVTYQYQLEGYDLGWITTKDQEAIYPDLSPGEYTFKVRSAIDGQFEGTPVVRYGFRIASPFWMRGWFIALLLILTGVAIYLYVKSRERRLQALERMEKERIDFQFQTLRSQVNPHFLFNSFNTLLNVIDMDKERAVTYVEKLSDFFRSILAYREAAIISLEEELKVVQDYYYLQQQRYGDNFSLAISIEDPTHYAVPPLLLQLLVENALKHNVVSRAQPLTVQVYIEDDDLVVRNNLQRKTESEGGTRVGLANIRKRYEMLTDRPVRIAEENNWFTVRLPIIPLES